ncbi:hypothetical protein DRE_05207 [Drechslerella stenobrocha 248]|uniref:TauD/TfdA-like domain-containing protein n=1 Tax=Drechslerella stenobrocha 248 TaxID=1043628 RepID=W7HNL7_9PEZI|nr:hypothetical protein DRE_05207 [Drechslerella stenobrocha 248]
MAPTAVSGDAAQVTVTGQKTYPEPIRVKGFLEKFKFEDITPVIGTEFPEVNIVDDIINAPNTDELLRDLAITISERGVVFFRAQDNLTNDIQKHFINRLGQLAGKPTESTLHIHPVLNDERELGGSDPEISTISSVQRKTLYRKPAETFRNKAAVWHSDISFEPFPADYSSLRLVQLPTTGGDTVWASGYELYDRLSAPYQKFLEGLTATHIGVGFHEIAKAEGLSLYDKPRGNPGNIGLELTAVHPVIRTNPVTGWKSLFPVGVFPRRINEVTLEESDALLTWFQDLIYKNHDLHVRFKWRNSNDLAIWDNRSVFHTATNDYDGLGERFGNRAVGVGEAPYFDPNSRSRREELAERAGLKASG